MKSWQFWLAARLGCGLLRAAPSQWLRCLLVTMPSCRHKGKKGPGDVLYGLVLITAFSINPGSSQSVYPVYSYNSFLCEIGNGTKSITLFSNNKPLWDSNSDTDCRSENSQSPARNFLNSGDMVTEMLYSTRVNTRRIFTLERPVQK